MAKTERDLLLQKLVEVKKQVPIGSRWVHHKSMKEEYEITDVVINESDEEVAIVYNPLYERLSNVPFVRLASVFLEEVKKENYSGPRFKMILRKEVRVALASKNEIKAESTTEAFQAAYFDPQLNTFEVESHISEQPMDLAEIHQGAQNRIADLKAKARDKFDFYVAYEGGYTKLDNKSYVGVGVTIIETSSGEHRTTVVSDAIMPKAMFDEFDEENYKVQPYLINKKGMKPGTDPIAFLTNGVYTRRGIVKQGVLNALKELTVK